MDKNEIELSIEINKLLRTIIKYQNINLIKNISKDYDRNFHNMLYKYNKGVYN